MTMQVKEERVDPDYQRGGQYVTQEQPIQHQQVPTYYPAPATYQLPAVQAANKTPTSKSEEPVNENQVDFSSVKGIFGWTTIDGVDVPYIFRKDKMFVSVRIVEQKLLSKYPNSYPDDLGKHQPLTSFFITINECKLLNEINQVHCGGEFGTKLFTIKDLIVLLSDFVEFYNLVKKTFPENNKKYPEESTKLTPGSECGWLQVNNTVTPYVRREADKFVPLSVMKYAAALNIPGTGVLPMTEECDLLNKACKIAGFNFSFSKTTRIISLSEIIKDCKIKIMELPMENPLQHAQYIELPSTNKKEPTENQVSEQQSPKPENNHMKSPGQEMMHPAYPHHSAFMDPRMMFSYNRHPFNMYAMQYGPPNVTVNPRQHNPYNQGMRPPPPYLNGQMPGPVPQGSKNGPQDHRPSQSPARSPGSSNSKSPMTSPNPYAQMRPQLSPNSYPHHSQGMPMPSNRPPQSGHMPPQSSMMFPNPMTNFMQNHGNYMPNIRQNMNGNGPHMRPGYPVNHVPRHPQNSKSPSNTRQASPCDRNQGRQPPSMSGPHQGPMNALQSMVSHQPTNFQGNDSQGSSQRHVQNDFRQQSNNNQRPNQNNVENQPPHVNIKAAEGKEPIHNTQRAEVTSNDKGVNQSLVESIKGVWLGGKSISCMHLNQTGRTGKFCLVEAVCKLYFSGCSVNEFLYALMNVLKVPLMTCTDDEEKAFIHYYSLPVTVLKCNKMIDFEDLDKFFPQLSYVFKEKTGNTIPEKSTSQEKERESSSGRIIDPLSTMPMTLSEMQQSNKRPSTTNLSSPPTKTSKRLEDTVQRLMNQRGSTVDDKPSSGAAIIILDD